MMARRSSSLSKPARGRFSPMGLDLRERRVVQRQKRALSELGDERGDPEAAERDRERQVEPVDPDPVGREGGRVEPEEGYPVHHQNEDDDRGEAADVALQLAR